MPSTPSARRALAGVSIAVAVIGGGGTLAGAGGRGDLTDPTTPTTTPPVVAPRADVVVTPTTGPADLGGAGRADDVAPAPGTLTCEDGCIQEALLTNEVGPGVRLDVETAIPTAVNVWITDEAHPPVDGELPYQHVDLVLSLGDFVTERSETITGLSPDTTYWVALEVLDQFGTEQVLVDALHTDGAGGLDSGYGPSGCLVSCITEATFTPTADGLRSHVHVETHTSAEMWVWVSPTPFPVDDDGDLVPPAGADAIASTDGLDQQVWNTEVTLPYDTDLHVVVGARDLAGQTSYQVGEIQTQPAPGLVATYRQVTVTATGDGAGNGEFGFLWGTDEAGIAGYVAQSSSRGSTGVHGFGAPTVELTAADHMSEILFGMTEFDPTDGIPEVCPFDAGGDMPTGAGDYESCGLTYNPLTPLQFFGATFAELPDCAAVGYPQWSGSRCLVADSLEPGAEYAEYELVVTVDLAP